MASSVSSNSAPGVAGTNATRKPVRILPAHVVNRIAAGEVVERPASVVKELVENALDAGATRIEIFVSAGGRTLRVADNGSGMNAEDARLAFYNHATSKIQDETDLDRIETLGFRGEALASIASIAKLTCLTRTADSSSGLRVTFDPASPAEPVIAEAGCAVGTVMEVVDLFYNTPARLKFLKRPTTELGHIEETVEMLALSHPAVRFQLVMNEKTALKTSGSGDLKIAMQEIFKLDKDPLDLMRVDQADADAGYALCGFSSPPGVMKSSKRWLLTFVNNRAVKCPLMCKAIEAAYESLLPAGRYPVSVIFLTLPTDEVDVNVHPTKREVRYASAGTVFSFVRTGLKNAMLQAGYEAHRFALPENVSSSNGSPHLADAPGFASTGGSVGCPSMFAPRGVNPGLGGSVGGTGAKNGATLPNFHRTITVPVRPGSFAQSAEITSQAALDLYRPMIHESGRISADLPFATELSAEDQVGTGPQARYKVLGQLFNTYILLETAQGLMVVDQHIASERELFELFSRQMFSEAPPSQPLITGPAISLSPVQLERLESLKETLQALGFDYDLSSETPSATLKAVPILYQERGPNQDPVGLFQDMLHQLEETGEASLAADHQVNHLIATLACHTAVRAGDPLSYADMVRVIDGWLTSTLPWTCPHGRPIAHTIRKDELNKFFDRPSLPVNSL